MKKAVAILGGTSCLVTLTPSAHPAAVAVSGSAPSSNVLLSQTTSGGSGHLDSEQHPSPLNNTNGQSFTPTGLG